MEIVYVQALKMLTGEVIHLGKVLGYVDETKEKTIVKVNEEIQIISLK